ncbi:MAG TPA: hypothetical protein VME01_11145, partial [Solirubrobacteraceae bacterium]|nr:hypothetical protein [Solirubrobacteraceae bacterium]
MSRAASALATGASSRAETCTIRPTSGWSVATRASGWTRRILAASEVTSSVDIVHMPIPRNSTSGVTNATRRSRHSGIGITRRGVSSTSSAAGCGSGTGAGAGTDA